MTYEGYDNILDIPLPLALSSESVDAAAIAAERTPFGFM